MRTIEVREEEHYQKWQNAMMLWQKRKDAHVMKLAKSFFAKIKKESLKKYTGYSLVEDFPVFDKFLSVDDLKPFFEEHSDLAKLDKFIEDAENKAKMPKFLTMDEPKWLKAKKATEELEEQKGWLQTASNLRGKSKFHNLKF